MSLLLLWRFSINSFTAFLSLLPAIFFASSWLGTSSLRFREVASLSNMVIAFLLMNIHSIAHYEGMISLMVISNLSLSLLLNHWKTKARPVSDRTGITITLKIPCVPSVSLCLRGLKKLLVHQLIQQHF